MHSQTTHERVSNVTFRNEHQRSRQDHAQPHVAKGAPTTCRRSCTSSPPRASRLRSWPSAALAQLKIHNQGIITRVGPDIYDFTGRVNTAATSA